MRRRRDAGDRDESTYRVRRWLGATFYTSRQRYGDLTLVVKRFPVRDEAFSDTTFLLVHGIGVSSRYFQPLASQLARHGSVYLVDLPGFGAAPKPRRRGVSIADHAGALAGFLERSEITNPVIVGHSWGSQVVAQLAGAHPEISDRIVLMSPTLEPSARTLWSATGHLLSDAMREPPVVFGIAVTDYLIRCGVPYLLWQLPFMLSDQLELRLPALAARVLVINGDRDPIVSAGWAERLGGLGARFAYREVHGPHVIMHTEPAMVAAHIVAFSEGRPS